MAGPGAIGKPDSSRVRGNKGKAPSKIVPLERADRQDMPDDLLDAGEVWHPATIRWWDRWAQSALVEDWTVVDWSEFEACAVLHHEFMKKRTFTLASEIRLRMQKFGATPEDRARLRIVFADADEKDEKRAAKRGEASRARRGPLKAV